MAEENKSNLKKSNHPDEDFFKKMALINASATAQKDESAPKDVSEAYGKIAEIISNPKNIKILTELDKHEIGRIASIFALADYLEMPELKELAEQIMYLKISKGRKGRKELLQLAQNIGSTEDNMKQGRLSRLLGLGGRI